MTSLGVKTSGTVIFLYLLTAKDAGIGHLQNEQNNGAGIKDKTPSLVIQEHENIQNAPMGNSPPPVPVHVNSNKASMVPYNVPGDNPGIQKQFQPSQSRQSSHLPVPPPRVEGMQKESRYVFGWFDVSQTQPQQLIVHRRTH